MANGRVQTERGYGWGGGWGGAGERARGLRKHMDEVAGLYRNEKLRGGKQSPAYAWIWLGWWAGWKGWEKPQVLSEPCSGFFGP